jgi:hypothetical protein
VPPGIASRHAGILAGYGLPGSVLAWAWIGLYLPDMLHKGERVAPHPGWAGYRACIGLLLPRLSAN